jgi:hypothetical protein
VNDSLILAGNNEDWEDPAPKMWFFPAQEGKYGWVKFGWGSGFPQGGMNEKGLFWDGTAGPYLAMPYSEANKEKYAGPLMQKIIEECADIEEARVLFSDYYCEDQYKAQYLVGDVDFRAIIVEGDSIIPMSADHMVLTNFYHSHPELGGYPCSRYETAKEMIEGSENFTPALVGSILSATHQEGRYPTQYSQIYDLRHKIFYLFYYHNYEEFIVIDLNNELKKSSRSYDIPELFAQITLIAPLKEELISTSTVEFSWMGKAGFQYDIIFSPDPEFPDDRSTSITFTQEPTGKSLYLIYGFAGLLLFISMIRTNRTRLLVAVLFVLGISQIRCAEEDIPEDEERMVMTATAGNLQPLTTYYWKLKAHPINSYDFQSETVVKRFYTGETGPPS